MGKNSHKTETEADSLFSEACATANSSWAVSSGDHGGLWKMLRCFRRVHLAKQTSADSGCFGKHPFVMSQTALTTGELEQTQARLRPFKTASSVAFFFFRSLKSERIC